MHHGGAFGEVSAEANAVSITDAHSRGHHVIHHAGELIDGVHGDWATLSLQASAGELKAFHCAGAVVGPHHVAEQSEHAIQVAAVWLEQAAGDQVEAEVRVIGIGGGSIQIRDHCADGHAAHATDLIGTHQVSGFRADLGGINLSGARVLAGGIRELEVGEPSIEDNVLLGQRCKSITYSSSHSGESYRNRGRWWLAGFGKLVGAS